MSEIEYTCNNCGHEGHNTRAVPDVPELVRYSHDQYYSEMRKSDNGKYILYSQAAEIFAAKDKEIERLKLKHTDEMNDFVLMGMARDEFKNRAETAEAKLSAMEANK